MYSSGNIDVRNWVYLFESRCIYRAFHDVLCDYKHNKKTKGPTLNKLFTATGILKKKVDNKRCLLCAPRETWQAHIDTIFKFLPHTHVNMGASILFTAVMIRAFRSARSRGNGGTNIRSLTFHQRKKVRVTIDLLVWYFNTQNDFSPGAAIFSLHTLASPSDRNVNYDKNQLTGKKCLISFYLCRFGKYVSYGSPIIKFCLCIYIYIERERERERAVRAADNDTRE
jgi:hypothetical protein